MLVVIALAVVVLVFAFVLVVDLINLVPKLFQSFERAPTTDTVLIQDDSSNHSASPHSQSLVRYLALIPSPMSQYAISPLVGMIDT